MVDFARAVEKSERRHSMVLTNHSAQRLQQRGIPFETLALLEKFGRRVYDHRGGCVLVFDRNARREITEELGKAAAQLRYSVCAVVDAAHKSTLITAFHRQRRVRDFS